MDAAVAKRIAPKPEAQPLTSFEAASTPVIIVAFGNADDVRRCLHALGQLYAPPAFEVFICENGGTDAFDRLVGVLTGPQGPCEVGSSTASIVGPKLARVVRLLLRSSALPAQVRVHVGEAVDNLGYAGGVNAFLAPLRDVPGWSAVWILNPDTQPEPDALRQLADYAALRDCGMVGSRISPRGEPDIVHTRGLAWRKWRAKTLSVDRRTPVSAWPAAQDVDSRLDSPSGASMFVTRDCLDRIGLMDESYFLYFEDLDWGLRAKTQGGGVGYAHDSIVLHEGGTTIGGAAPWSRRSALSIYLDYRNRLRFVDRHFPAWLPWTVFVGMAEIVAHACLGRFRTAAVALRGLLAGLAGRSGPPRDILRVHPGAPRAGTSRSGGR